MGPGFKKIFSAGGAGDSVQEPTPSYVPSNQETPIHTEEDTAPSWKPESGAPASTPAYSPVPRGNAKNVLNADVAVRGTLKFTDDLLIDGIVEGEISSQGVLTIGENANVTAEIRTSSLIIHGKLHGNVFVNDRVELKSTAELIGDIKAASIAIEAGATFVGRSEVGAATQVSTPPASPAKATEKEKKESSAPVQEKQQIESPFDDMLLNVSE